MGALHVVTTKAFLRAFGNKKHRCAPPLPKLMLGVSTLLASFPGRVISAERLVDWLYGGDEDGGPEWAKNNIRVAVHRLRERGVPIKTHGWAGYSLG